jgi:SEC-C motif-containing protein
MQTIKPLAACPCGGASYAICCASFIDGAAIPASAEQLMRSRYTAYTLGNEAYLRATWHPSTCPQETILDDGEKTKWLGLEIKSALRLRQRNETGAEDGSGQDSVEFVARYKLGGRAHRLHEVSRFVREDGADGPRWYYLDGSFPGRSGGHA